MVRIEVICCCLVLAGFVNTLSVARQVQSQQIEQIETRRIWDDGFLRKRPRQRRVAIPNHAYRRVGPGSPRQYTAADSILGITLWRLRSSASADNHDSRDLVHDAASGKIRELTAERIEAERPISEGEFIRISIESPRPGYLYVIDRERYSDGSMGPPSLIFPTKRLAHGHNLVGPGKVVQIPATTDTPPYLTVKRNPRRQDQVAEILILLVTPTPLDIVTPNEATHLAPDQLLAWEQQWGREVERLELQEGAGQTRTRAEKFAARGGRPLRQNESPPQTIYRAAGGQGKPLLVTVTLPFEPSP